LTRQEDTAFSSLRAHSFPPAHHQRAASENLAVSERFAISEHLAVSEHGLPKNFPSEQLKRGHYVDEA
jgi:hypothetical protein